MTPLLAYLYGAIKNHRLRFLLIKKIAQREGGEMTSQTLRKLFEKHHGVEVGLYSYGCFNFINIRPGVSIGRYCSFGCGVWVFDANHPVQFKSTHPYFYEPAYGYVNKFMAHQTAKKIENDVWIGNNALILPSVKRVGNGAIIGAGAVVTKDVPDYAIAAGNPARIIGYRFKPDTVRDLLAEKWWEKDIRQIKDNLSEYTTSINH